VEILHSSLARQSYLPDPKITPIKDYDCTCGQTLVNGASFWASRCLLAGTSILSSWDNGVSSDPESRTADDLFRCWQSTPVVRYSHKKMIKFSCWMTSFRHKVKRRNFLPQLEFKFRPRLNLFVKSSCENRKKKKLTHPNLPRSIQLMWFGLKIEELTNEALLDRFRINNGFQCFHRIERWTSCNKNKENFSFWSIRKHNSNGQRSRRQSHRKTVFPEPSTERQKGTVHLISLTKCSYKDSREMRGPRGPASRCESE